MTQQTRKNRRKSQEFNLLGFLLGPVGMAVLMVALIGGLWARNRMNQVPFEPVTDAETSETVLADVETDPNLGQDHVSPGQPVNYEAEFPTSGPHDPNPVMPGVYDQTQRPEMLVHSLEHGNIVIYYDQPNPETMQAITSWAEQFTDPWAGIVAVPKEGLNDSIVLTAWTKRLVMDTFDPSTAATFIDEYRGRGPENPVR